MDPTPETFRLVISLIGIVLVAVGGILYLLPVGECDKCAHCREQRVADATPCQLHRVPMSRCRTWHRDDGDEG